MTDNVFINICKLNTVTTEHWGRLGGRIRVVCVTIVKNSLPMEGAGVAGSPESDFVPKPADP